MSKRREWPNCAKGARDRSAEAAIAIVRNLRPLVLGMQFTETERLRRMSSALSDAQHIALELSAVGAPIRPEDI